jgi:ketosteroid isomerase-like protein
MASARVLELLRREPDAEELADIRELWTRHSMAEERRDVPGLLSTLTEDCVYLAQTGHRWEGMEPSGEHLRWKVVIFFPWNRQRRLFTGERIYTGGLPLPGSG